MPKLLETPKVLPRGKLTGIDNDVLTVGEEVPRDLAASLA